jgi:STE24 endopeptidase
MTRPGVRAAAALVPLRKRLALGGLVLLAGVVLGFAASALLPREVTMGGPPSASALELMRRNLAVGALLAAGGLLLAAPTLLLLLVNGAVVGWVCGTGVHVAGGLPLAAVAILPHAVLEVPGFLFFAAAGLGLAAHVAHLFDEEVPTVPARRLLAETAAGAALICAAAPVEAHLTTALLSLVMQKEMGTMPGLDTLLRWGLVVLLAVLPAMAVRAALAWVAARRPASLRAAAMALCLASPVLAVLAAGAAFSLHPEWVAERRAAAAGRLDGNALAVLAMALAVGLPAILGTLAAALRILRGDRTGARTQADPVGPVTMALTVALVAAAMGGSLLLQSQLGAPPAVARMVSMTGCVALLFLAGPLMLRLVARRAEVALAPEVRREVDAVLARAGIAGHRLEVVEVKGGAWANALAVGAVPGRERIVLTRRLAEVLTPREIAAVVAHEAGHVRGRHVARLAGVALGVSALGVLATQAGWTALAHVESGIVAGVGQTLLSTLVSCVAVPGALALAARRVEREADAYTRELGYGAALASALRRLLEANAWPGADHGIERWFALHPPVEERVAALSGPPAPLADGARLESPRSIS